MKIHMMFVLLTLFFTACDRSTEDRQGYREEQEEETTPNDYTTGKDSEEVRQTGGKGTPAD